MDKTVIQRVSPIDENHLLYGNFIGLQYAFEDGLSPETLAKSISALVSQFPALSGRYYAKQGDIRLKGDSVSLTYNSHSDNMSDILSKNTRLGFIQEPRRTDVLKSRVPLSTFTLTQFKDGSVIFGIAISHILSDAAGFHMLMRHLGDIYTAIASEKQPPKFPFIAQLDAFEFGRGLSKPESLAELKRRGLPKPIPIKGLVGRLIKFFIIKAMDKSIQHNTPIKVHFSADQIAHLKETVLMESGEDWISTNVALCAHFTSLMAKLSYGDDIKTEMQIGQLLDLRGRYFEANADMQSKYVGNAILIHIDKAAFPDGLQNASRGALARYFKQRQAKTTTEAITDRLDLLADCLAHGYTNPELDVKKPIISLNNQSKMAVYDIHFDTQKPIRIYPQDVGDNIMFFPAADGGVEIYMRDLVNPGGQEKLLTPEWQSLIYNV